MTKTINEYQQQVNGHLYEKIPKAVLCAILVSLLINKENETDVDTAILKEWKTLHTNGIVPQVPTKI